MKVSFEKLLEFVRDGAPLVWSELSERDRDALVAEYVFSDATVQWFEGHPGEPLAGCGIWKFGGERSWVPLPRFSTDIAAAWEVVEKAFPRGDPFVIYRKQDDPTGTWHVSFDIQGNRAFEWGETAPDAICKAGLRVMGVEVED